MSEPNDNDVFDDVDEAELLQLAEVTEAGSPSGSQLTEAQKSRVEKNRLKALALKQARLTSRCQQLQKLLFLADVAVEKASVFAPVLGRFYNLPFHQSLTSSIYSLSEFGRVNQP